MDVSALKALRDQVERSIRTGDLLLPITVKPTMHLFKGLEVLGVAEVSRRNLAGAIEIIWHTLHNTVL